MIREGKIFAIDFDGTLYLGPQDNFPFVDETCLNFDLIKQIKHRQKANPQDKFILWTCREEAELQCALDSLKFSGIQWAAVNENISEIKLRYGDCRKIIADYYIDDRALHYSHSIDLDKL